jgi:YfiH family protein
VELETRRAAAPHHFDAAPQHILRVSGAEGLHRRFLRREASGKMNGWVPSLHAVRDFAVREDPLNEPLAVALDGGGNSRNVRSVNAESNDCRHHSMIPPPPDHHFEWRETAFGPALVCLPLERIAPHLFTTRTWALGQVPSSPDAWHEPAAALAVPHHALRRLTQVHGCTAVLAGDVAADDPPPEADIVLSSDPALAVAVQAADCVPLLIADARLGVVAAAHAGWRGLVQRVPAKVVDDLARAFGSRPSDLVVAIGPSVGSCCYEVGADVTAAFAAAGCGERERDAWFSATPSPSSTNPSMPGLPVEPRAGHVYFDGWRCAREQLLQAGIPDTQVYGAGICTASHAILSSYRRDGKQAGRTVGVIRATNRGERAERR